MTARYHFISTFRFDGALDPVWTELMEVEQWPQWWPWLKRVEVLRASVGDGVGAVYRNTVRAPAGYGFVYETETTAVEPRRLIDARSSGDLVGRGRLAVESSSGSEFTLRFAWLVETPKLWMRALAPIARPAFTWNHGWMMNAFGAGLADRSGARLVSSEHTTIKPGRPGFWIMPEFGGNTDPNAKADEV
ncbi:SRPBCC family protein [Sinomonas sp. JGH33]|uniref:SRPBCC family protein n=1 Tax=Sinomonas terricola TaxID=3110330 RepID=A0ABU5TBT1_9MICC|nr:SRPBCC family protein [Sinomonas sp. JGH33]MEA5457141.1 SRPBCC family protein [Sinomonas sp. JGH33]